MNRVLLQFGATLKGLWETKGPVFAGSPPDSAPFSALLPSSSGVKVRVLDSYTQIPSHCLDPRGEAEPQEGNPLD